MSCGHKWKVLDTTFYCVELSGHQCAHYYKILPSDVQRFAERAERAEADLAAVRADAERYRWLRSATTIELSRTVHTTGYLLGRELLDAAIDAARAAT